MKSIVDAIIFVRSLLAGIFILLWTLVWSLLTLSGAFFFKGRWWGDFITSYWAWGMLKPFCIHTIVTGQENYSDEPGIFVFNHSSHFDIPLVFWNLRSRHLRFGSKAELFRIPVFGQAITSVGILKIHRSRREEVLKLYKESLKNLETGTSYILAPEGTRQTTGDLGKFKSGPFIMAISGQVPIYPITIEGAAAIMPKFQKIPAQGSWHFPVKIKVLEKVETKGLSLDDRPQLQDRVREMMASH